MAEGHSKTVVACCLGITKETLYAWARTRPEFSDAIKKGEELSLAWWEEQGRASLRDRNFNTAVWQINMRNRLGWDRNVQQVSATNNVLVANPAQTKAFLEKMYPGVDIEDDVETIEAEARRIDQAKSES